ncbi:hypothetical protein BpHYR1_006586 [Brachionus plicatilis]|uniref:Uncharacterized protein n=1 Tax=Brachionus plicatilis TaxID=10195 RepID=A0A3M7PHM7_BRAPC|nr:hypothetical protein BpHYR1_006586 [Brachionus plicatilis]
MPLGTAAQSLGTATLPGNPQRKFKQKRLNKVISKWNALLGEMAYSETISASSLAILSNSIVSTSSIQR